MNPDKPGLKTTEFWLVLLGFALTLLTGLTVADGVVSFTLDLEFAKWWLAAVMAYIGGRTIAKVEAAKRIMHAAQERPGP